MAGGALPVAAAGLLVAFAVCVAVACRPGRRGRWWRVLARLLWVVALLGVGYLTLVLTNPGVGGVNLVPFDTIQRQLRYQSLSMALFNILGNVLVLAPFGLLARPAFGWGWLRTTVLAFGLSTTIEILQAISGRSPDVDDILLNTVGASLAAVLAWLVFVIARWRQREDVSPPNASPPADWPDSVTDSMPGPRAPYGDILPTRPLPLADRR